jgi:hypothetical protein
VEDWKISSQGKKPFEYRYIDGRIILKLIGEKPSMKCGM